MTDRLYYTYPGLREFDATVTDVSRGDGRTLVRLDRSSFYPTSGGQPFDTGHLGGWRVVDVFEDDAGEVVHVVDESAAGPPGAPADAAPVLQAGLRVHGEIDWPRRLDHMQQHSGQHVLSAAIEHLFRVATVSFHLGADASTIDLSREMSALELAAAESEANRIVWEDRPVAISFASPSDAAQLPLRKESVRQGPLRLIAIRDYDLSACGGTHVASTGAIGMIVLDRVERFKGGQRLEFLCGRRVLDRFRALRGTTDAAARLLSTSVGELPEALARLQTDAKELRRAADAMRAELVRFRADALAVTAEPTAAGGLVLRTVDDDAAGLRILAAALAAKHGLIVVLVSIAAPTLVVVARSADVALNAQEVLATLMARFGGRGGGRADLAQGGGLNAAPDAILDQARRAISAA